MADRTSTVRVNVITDSSGAGAKLAGFGKVAGLAALGVGALAVGVGFGANKLAEFADVSDDADAKIENVVKTMGLFGKEADTVSARVEAMAKSVSQATAVDINSIKATQAKLLTFKELAKSADTAGGAFDRATAAAVDMAALGFGTAETNAVQLGKALNNPITGMTKLSRAGIEFTESEQARIKTLVESNRLGKAQEFMLAAIEKQVGGTAEATAGGFEKMKNELAIFGNELAVKALPLLDAFGTFMIEKGGPALLAFGRSLEKEVMPTLRQFGQFLIDEGIPAAKRLGKSFQEDVLPTLRQFGKFIRDQVVPAIIELDKWIMEHIVPVVRDFLVKALERGRDAFNQVRESVRRNRPQLEDMGDKLKKIATWIADNVLPVMADMATVGLPVLGAAIDVAITSLSGAWTAFDNLWSIIKNVLSAVGALKDALSNIPHVDIPGVGRVAGAAVGGITPGNQIRVVDGATRTVNINFNGLVTDPRAAAREVEKVLRRNGVASGNAVA